MEERVARPGASRPPGRVPGILPLFAADAVVAAIVFVAVALAWTAYVHKTGHEIADSRVYQAYAERVLDGDVPYRDFRLEYPPLSLAPALPVALVTRTPDQFYVVYAGVLALVGAVGILLVARTLVVLERGVRARRTVLATLALSPLAFGSVALSRFDLLAATVTCLAVLLVVLGRPRAAAVALGVAIATKVYPVLLVPLLAVLVAHRSGRRDALAAAGLAVGTAAAVYLPFLAASPGGVVESVRWHLERPLQLESLGAAVLVALHHLTGLHVERVDSYGSANVAGARGVTLLLDALLVVSLAWVYGDFLRRAPTIERFLRSAALVLLAAVTFSKIGSPQFLLWLLFPLALQQGGRGRAAGVAFAAAAVATAAYFPFLYRGYLRLDDGWGAALVLGKGVALLAAFLLLAGPPWLGDGRLAPPDPRRAPPA